MWSYVVWCLPLRRRPAAFRVWCVSRRRCQPRSTIYSVCVCVYVYVCGPMLCGIFRCAAAQ